MMQIIETRIQGNEVPNVNLTIQMLKGMIDALNQYDAECRIAETKPVTVRCYPEQGPAIDFSLDDEFDSEHIAEHTAIMVPQNELEGIFSIAEHLGEGTLASSVATMSSAPVSLSQHVTSGLNPVMRRSSRATDGRFTML